MAKVGAPPFPWTEEIETEIFSRMQQGESVKTICGIGRDDWLPSQVTFYKRVAEDEEFAKKYTRARETQAHLEAEEIREIADAATPENVHVARLQIDARKWRAGKLAPKVYGDKLAIGGASDLPPVRSEVSAADLLRERLDAVAKRLGTDGEASGE